MIILVRLARVKRGELVHVSWFESYFGAIFHATGFKVIDPGTSGSQGTS